MIPSSTLVTAAVVIAVALLPMLAPANPAPEGVVDTAALKGKYDAFDKKAALLSLPLLFLMFLPGILLGTVFWGIAEVIGRYTAEDAVYRLLPDITTWYTAGCVLALGFLDYVAIGLLKWALKDNYHEYLLYSEIKYGYNGMSVLGLLAKVIRLGAVVLIFLMSDFYVDIGKDQLAINDFTGITVKKYPWEAVQSIHWVRKEKTENREIEMPHYYIQLSNGASWKTTSWLNFGDREVEIIRFMSEKTGVGVDSLEIDPGN